MDAAHPPAHIVRDLHATLARLRTARIVNPEHERKPKAERSHSGCEVCQAQRRLDWLIDQLPRNQEKT